MGLPMQTTRTNGDANADRCSSMKLCAEGEFPTHQSQALLHACEAKPGPFHGFLGIEAKPRIRDGQIDLIQRTHKRHLEVFCMAMLRGILKGLL